MYVLKVKAMMEIHIGIFRHQIRWQHGKMNR